MTPYSDVTDYAPYVNELCAFAASAFIVFGGTIPFYCQNQEIIRTENFRGFSLFVCLNLIFSNCLRIMFWWGKQFELPLLFQSVVMIACMLCLIRTSVRVRKKQRPNESVSLFASARLKDFWQWTDLTSFVVATMAMFSLLATATLWFADVQLYTELIGSAALFLEANLGTPQVWRNYQRKSTFGLSCSMTFLWLISDLFKTVYFYVRQSPVQFRLCGYFQIFLDVILLYQFVIYGPRGTLVNASSI